MTDPLARLRRFLRELKRRKVYRAAAGYLVVAFVVLQLANLAANAFGFPGWFEPMVWVLAGLGFPIVLVLAWAFEMTPEGMQRTSAEKGGTEETEGTSMSPEKRRAQSRLAMKALVGLGLVGAAVAGGWYLMGGGGKPRAETAASGDTASTEPRLGDRSIAVLPFEALGKEEPGTFTEGMHDDLLARLSNVSGLKVISRTAVAPYRDTDLSTGDIADSLGVRWVMEGGVQEMGDQIQVNAQLIDPHTETHAWADTYRRDLTAANLFDLQSEITKRIARSLEAQLSPEETERVERRPTEDLDAYKLYVQGRSRLDTRTEVGVRDAVDYFRRAIEQDSSYALAWSGLADAIGVYPRYGPDSVPASLPEHAEAARRALELDPDLAEARASMGLVYRLQRNAPAALRELQQAVELKPSYGQAHHWLGNTYFNIGRLDPAIEHMSLAVELTPRWTARQVLVAALIAEGDLKAAERHVHQATRSGSFRGLRARILYHAGRWDELEALARDRLEEGAEAGPPTSFWRFLLARIAAFRGDPAAAREQLSEIREAEAYFGEGLTHAALGEVDEAFLAWDQLEAWEGPPLIALRYFYSDILDPLREDPRYTELIGEINRQWGLNPDGSIPDSVDVSFESPQSDE